MRDRKLTGTWNGYEFRNGALVTPEGYEFHHDDLRWLSLTVSIKREWQAMMAEHRGEIVPRPGGNVLQFRDGIRRRYRRQQERDAIQQSNEQIISERIRRA